MKYVLDTHTHTIASGHAYSSIREMVKAASDKGLELLCITDHAPSLPGACHEFYFMNLKVVDRNVDGIELLLGVELNIMDMNGTIDMPAGILNELDIVVASLHTPCVEPGSREENTRSYLLTMENPYVSIIGHPDDSRYPVDYDALVKGAKENDVLLEVNNSSLSPKSFRENARENYIEMLKQCEKYGTYISIGSDAHFDTAVGNHEDVEILMKEVGFPEELVINRSSALFKEFISRKRSRL